MTARAHPFTASPASARWKKEQIMRERVFWTANHLVMVVGTAVA
jgi:hypothetical protein